MIYTLDSVPKKCPFCYNVLTTYHGQEPRDSNRIYCITCVSNCYYQFWISYDNSNQIKEIHLGYKNLQLMIKTKYSKLFVFGDDVNPNSSKERVLGEFPVITDIDLSDGPAIQRKIKLMTTFS